MSVMDLWRRGRRGEQDQARVAFDFDADPESSSEDWIYTEKLIYIPVRIFDRCPIYTS